jgi:hypothetical protein
LATIINEYLDSIKDNLRLGSPDEKEIISELATHIEDEIQDLQENGLKEDEAVRTCLKLLGSAKSVARHIYEAHSQGTWQQAFFASLPHLFFALIFFLNWWRGIIPVLLTLIVILGMAVYGWWHGRSNWLFPWLGYSLLPVIAAGLMLLYLPKGLAWVTCIVYVPLALWLILRVVSQTIKKDWMYLSLMLLPLPIIISWFAVTEWQGSLDISSVSRISSYVPWIAMSFLALAFGVISFVRIRRRWLKIAVLFMTGAITLTIIAAYANGQISFIKLLLLMLLLGSIFFIPALLENGVRSGRWGKIFDHRPMT